MKCFYHHAEPLPFNVQLSTEEVSVIVYWLWQQVEAKESALRFMNHQKVDKKFLKMEKKQLRDLKKVAKDFEEKTRASIK